MPPEEGFVEGHVPELGGRNSRYHRACDLKSGSDSSLNPWRGVALSRCTNGTNVLKGPSLAAGGYRTLGQLPVLGLGLSNK